MKETNETGRNDACPCGSGKKFKKCCLSIATPKTEVADFAWRKLRKIEGTVVDNHLLPYLSEQLPDAVIQLARQDFFPHKLPEEIVHNDELFRHFFMPWVMFSWIPFEDFGIVQFNPEATIASNYAKLYGSRLSHAEKRFIEEISQSYYSFYSILAVEVEKTLVVKDMLLGTTHTIKERQATHMLRRGDVVFSRILTIDNQSIFVGMAPITIPPRFQGHPFYFKKELMEQNNNHPLTTATLRTDFAIELVDCFFEIMKSAYSKELPTLLNTDGEPILFSKSYFQLDMSPLKAFNQLLPLTLSEDTEVWLQDAVHDKEGQITRIKFHWIKKGNKKHNNWDNTLMGDITIDRNKLILETNSEQRTEQGKRLLSQYLDKAVHFKQALIETPEQKLKSSSEKPQAGPMLPNPPKTAEEQAQLKAMAKAHWDNWFEQSIPLLDNRTPREAAQSEEGKEQLEALLLQYERFDLDRSEATHFLRADIAYLKKELALD